MVAVIHELRYSLSWFQMLKITPDMDWSNQNYMLDKYNYINIFNNIKTGNENRYTFPWSQLAPSSKRKMYTGDGFWTCYIECADNNDVEPGEAWRRLIPFRVSGMPQYQSKIASALPYNSRPLRIALEGFVYPHGIGVILTVFLHDQLSIPDAVDRICSLRHSPWIDSENCGIFTIEQTALHCLKILRGRHEVKNASIEWDALGEPLSLVTVIDAECVDSDMDDNSTTELLLALQGFCTQEQNWRNLLSQGERFPYKKPRKGHIFYGTRSGRAVWFPSHFEEARGDRKQMRGLGQYHRNIVLATLQTQGLIMLARNALDFIQGGKEEAFYPAGGLPLYLDTISRHAAGALGRLYNSGSAYQTWCVREQIERYKSKIDELRGYYWPCTHG